MTDPIHDRIGMFWPATLIGLALISIITAPSRGDTQ